MSARLSFFTDRCQLVVNLPYHGHGDKDRKDCAPTPEGLDPITLIELHPTLYAFRPHEPKAAHILGCPTCDANGIVCAVWVQAAYGQHGTVRRRGKGTIEKGHMDDSVAGSR